MLTIFACFTASRDNTIHVCFHDWHEFVYRNCIHAMHEVRHSVVHFARQNPYSSCEPMNHVREKANYKKTKFIKINWRFAHSKSKANPVSPRFSKKKTKYATNMSTKPIFRMSRIWKIEIAQMAQTKHNERRRRLRRNRQRNFDNTFT